MAERKTNKTASAVKKPTAAKKPAADKAEPKQEQPVEMKELFPEIQPIKAAEKPRYEAPMVKLLYLDSVIANNEIPIGGGRVISGSGRRFSVKLSDFEGTFLTPLVMKLLKKRKFIVLDGLNKEQREQYGVDYTQGEVLLNEGLFNWFFTGPVNEVKAVFADLCPEHRELVSARFLEAFEEGDNRMTRDRIEALNAISKKDYPDGKGAFTPILEAINKASL